MSTFNRYNKWQFMCVKILPLVYDDSLSYYEFLCKMNKVLTDVVEEVNEQGEAIEALQEAIESALTSDKVVQTTGTGTDVVMSQKAVTDALAGVTIELEQSTGQSTEKAMSQKAVTDALPVVEQSTGQSTTKVMSQKAVTDSLPTVSQSTGQSTSVIMSQKATTDAIGAVRQVPSYSAANEGQFLVVVSGVPTWTTVPEANGEEF